MAGDTAYTEVFGVPIKSDPLTIEGKPEMVKNFQDAFAVIDAAGLCVFLSVRYLFEPHLALFPNPLTQIMNHATGADYTEQSLMEAGERVFNLERLFLINAGFSREDDTLPKRMLEEPLPEGPGKGHIVELEQMLTKFYTLRGWDEGGIPTKEKLEALGLTNHV